MILNFNFVKTTTDSCLDASVFSQPLFETHMVLDMQPRYVPTYDNMYLGIYVEYSTVYNYVKMLSAAASPTGRGVQPVHHSDVQRVLF